MKDIQVNRKFVIRVIGGILLLCLFTVIRTILTSDKEKKQAFEIRPSSDPIFEKAGVMEIMTKENWNSAEQAWVVFLSLHRVCSSIQNDSDIARKDKECSLHYTILWLKRSASLGCPNAMVLMLELNAKRLLPSAFALSDNEKQHYSKNAVLLLNAKRVKDAGDYWALGTCYEMGYGVEADKGKAYLLRQKAIHMEEH